MLRQHIIRNNVVMVRGFCAISVFQLPICFGVSHSPTFRRRSKSEGLEEPFCIVEAKVPSEAGNANLMSQFSASAGSPMVSQDSLQSKALECIDNFYGRDCDSTLALNYTKAPNKKVAASAASHYGERLKKVQ
ncbi:unnamed protein product [Cylicostephanus goldi]|uniref:Uncharacterized protein n=1 Tax=Cylicostephanus goldi TaxID=71465 RepID=A0A3P6SYZ0_CYLGO|nr:unnamed protein product [Cylicostephanus goldi]